MAGPLVSVAVFAYNEEESIRACLDAIGACSAEAPLRVHVLINGCRDGTEAAVRAYPASNFELIPVVIERGDKANAWNHYTHIIAPKDASMHIFTDGDMTIAPGSIAAFIDAFKASPEARACAGLPKSGRNREVFRSNLVRDGGLAGNLYAVLDNSLVDFRRRGVRLPFGMFGEDGLVSTLIKWDLDTRGEPNAKRIAVAEGAGFNFTSLSPLRISDWKIYHNRRMRYAVRRQQGRMLYPLLWQSGVEAMPSHVVDLYRLQRKCLRLKWNGIDTWFDWRACRRIQGLIDADDTARDADNAHLYS